MGGLNKRIYLLTVWEVRSPRSKYLHGWLLVRCVFLFVDDHLPMSSHGLCVHAERTRKRERGRMTSGVSFFSYKDASPTVLGSHTLTSFNLNYLPNGPISKYSYLGIGGSICEF